MPIQARCPNKGCGQLLTVGDQFAGKKGRCPTCGMVFMIPVPRAARPAQPAAEYEVVDDNPNPLAGLARGPAYRDERPAHPQRGAPDDVEEAQYADEADDPNLDLRERLAAQREGRELPSRAAAAARPTVKGKLLKTKPVLGSDSITALAVGIVLLIGLALTPFLPWLSMSEKKSEGNTWEKKTTSVTGMGTATRTISTSEREPRERELEGGPKEGLGIMIISIVAAVIVAAGLSLCLSAVMERSLASDVLAGSMAAAAAWATAAIVWVLGYVWQVVTLAMEKRKDTRAIREMIKDRPGNLDYSATTLPSFGLWLGLFAAIGIAATLTHASGSLRRRNWLLIAEAAGFVIGLIIVLTYVQPWEIGFGGARRPF